MHTTAMSESQTLQTHTQTPLSQLPGWSSRKARSRPPDQPHHQHSCAHLPTHKHTDAATWIADGSQSQWREGDEGSQTASQMDGVSGGSGSGSSPPPGAAAVAPFVASPADGLARNDSCKNQTAAAGVMDETKDGSVDAAAASAPQQQQLTASSEWMAASGTPQPPHSSDATSVAANGASEAPQQRRTSLAALLALGPSGDLTGAAHSPAARVAAEHTFFSRQALHESAPLHEVTGSAVAQEGQTTSSSVIEAATTDKTIAAAALTPTATATDSANGAAQSSEPSANVRVSPTGRQVQAVSAGQCLPASVSSRDQQLQALVAEAESHAGVNGGGEANMTDTDSIQMMASPPSSLLQQAAARVAAATLSNSDDWLKQSSARNDETRGGVDGAGFTTTPKTHFEPKRSTEHVVPALPVPLLLAHVLDELIAPHNESAADHSASVHSRPPPSLSTAALRHMARTLGEAVQRGHTLNGGRETLLQSDMQRACDSIQRALRWLLVQEADGGDPTSLALETFFTALCDACPSLLLWCLLRQLDALITRCVGEAHDADSTTAPSTPLGSASLLLLDIPLLDLAERASKLTHLAELALLAQSRAQGEARSKSANGPPSIHPTRSASASSSVSSSGSAFTLLLTSFGLNWRDIWTLRFIGGVSSRENNGNEGAVSLGMRAAASSSMISGSSHCPEPSSAMPAPVGWLRSPRLGAHLPMLQAALWQLLGRMHSRQQVDDIARLVQP